MVIIGIVVVVAVDCDVRYVAVDDVVVVVVEYGRCGDVDCRCCRCSCWGCFR